ncbi:MAG: SDR family oxidoreductase [Kurthia sp.]|nr:SDR family oxidoreductase [Candidatus Kurthia equi]
MKVAILGATGRVGSNVLKKALADGHEVTALVRNPENIQAQENLKIIVGDAKDFQSIEQTIEGNEVVFSALNTDKTTTLSQSIVHIIHAMQKHNIQRIVTIGTAGILTSRLEPTKLRYQSVESRQRTQTAAKEHEIVFEKLQQTTFDWTIVCPTALLNEEEVGKYRYEVNFLPEEGRKISVLDTAAFSYDVISNRLFWQQRVGIAY